MRVFFFILVSLLTYITASCANSPITNEDLTANLNSQPVNLHPIPEVVQILDTVEKNSVPIAVLLPFSGQYSQYSTAIQDGFMQAYYQAKKHNQIKFYNADDSQKIMSIYSQAITDGAKLVIGPLLKNQLQELYTQKTLPVPTIALNRLDLPNRPENLFEFSLAPEDEIDSIIEYALKSKLHTAIVIAQKDESSQKNLTIFNSKWKKNGGNILASFTLKNTLETSSNLQSILNSDKSTVRIENLHTLIDTKIDSEPRRRQDIDMIMLFVKPEEVINLKSILEFNSANDIPIYANSSIYRGFPKLDIDKQLENIKFTDVPIIVNHSDIIKKYSSSPLIRFYAFGLDAYQLSEHLTLLQKQSTYIIHGATGEIILKDGIFKREIPLGVFTNGLIKPLSVFTIDSKLESNHG